MKQLKMGSLLAGLGFAQCLELSQSVFVPRGRAGQWHQLSLGWADVAGR